MKVAAITQIFSFSSESINISSSSAAKGSFNINNIDSGQPKSVAPEPRCSEPD